MMNTEVRLAALKVAVLSKQDQDWLLSRLSDEERLRISPLLQELETFDLHSRQETLTQLARKIEREMTDASSCQPALFQQWASASYDEIKIQLEQLPESLLLIVVGVKKWPWIEDLIKNKPTLNIASKHTEKEGSEKVKRWLEIRCCSVLNIAVNE